MLSHAIPPKASLWPILFQIDETLRDAAKAKGCPRCGARLDQADYRRKPRGGPDQPIGDVLCRRLSLCCAAEGCRKRVTPASARYLDRRVYLGVLVVLVAALREGATPTRMKTLSSTFGVDRRTVERWRGWWREVFSSSPGWRVARGHLAFPEERAPCRLIRAFDAIEAPVQQSRLMSFLASIPLPKDTQAEGKDKPTGPTQRMPILSS